MAIREYTKADEPAAWKTTEVEAYLRGLNFLIGPAGIGAGTRMDGDDVLVLVRVDLDANVPQEALDAALDAFVPAPDPIAEAQMQLRQVVAELRATPDAIDLDTVIAQSNLNKKAIDAFAKTQGV